MKAERLSALDVAFLCLEDTGPMHLGAVVVFDATPGFRPGRVAGLLAARAQSVTQLRRRIRPTWIPPGGARWVEDQEFDAGSHILRHQLRSGSSEDLAALSGQLMAEPLDLSRPPWQLHIVTGLAGGRFAVVAKFHHALCDAYGAFRLSRALLDDPDGRQSVTGTAERSGNGWPGIPGRIITATVNAATKATSETLTAVSIASSVVGRIRIAPASPLLTGTPAGRRVILAQVDMTTLRRAREQHGGTVHDILLAIISGALRHWLATRGEKIDKLVLRALVPTSQRRKSNMDTGGNMLSGYLCDLPVNEPDPAKRLHHLRASMDRNKAAGARTGAGALPVLADAVPPAVHRIVTPVVGRAAGWLFDLLVTTVPLSSAQLRLGGHPLRELYPLAPLARGQALAIALSRQNDNVYIGFHADSGALPDMDKLAEAVAVATTELADTATDRSGSVSGRTVASGRPAVSGRPVVSGRAAARAASPTSAGPRRRAVAAVPAQPARATKSRLR
jgi:WS/DGAT/MGAT family acyltransferase